MSPVGQSVVLSEPSAPARRPGRWLVLRRAVQLGLLALFLAGPWLGVWIVKGNLGYSYTLGVLPLTDPLVFLQMLAAGHHPERNAVLGVALVLAAYVLAGGRSYCAWVCPMNLVTDAAHGLRRRLGLPATARLPRQTRYWLLAIVLVVAAVTGTIAWELLNPVTMLMRGLLFGAGLAWLVVLAVFLFDLFVMDRGWCGRLCPMGACFSVIGRVAVTRVAAVRRAGAGPPVTGRRTARGRGTRSRR